MRKVLCIISNIILSYFYLSTSWMVSAAALFYLVAIGWDWSSPAQIVWVVATALIVLTPLFCILGIIISIVKWSRERYLGAFFWQFLPFGTISLSVVLFLVPVWIEALMGIFA